MMTGGIDTPPPKFFQEIFMNNNTATIFLSRLIGISEILVALSMLMHKQAFVELITAMVRDRPLLFLAGIITAIAGLAIVLSHNVWSGGAAPVIVTLFGWAILLKGLLSVFFAPEMIVSMVDKLRFEEYFYIYAAAPLMLGLYLTYAGFRSSLHSHVSIGR